MATPRNLTSLDAVFRVPKVACGSPGASIVRVGVFGITHHLDKSTGRRVTHRWFEGVRVDCVHRKPHYTFAVNSHTAPASVGDHIEVDISIGTDHCALSEVSDQQSAEALATACLDVPGKPQRDRSGNRELVGARVTGPLPHPIDPRLRVQVNGHPLTDVRHHTRLQKRGRHIVVQPKAMRTNGHTVTLVVV